MTEFLGIQVEILAGVLIPVGIGTAVITWRVIRYLISKEICFKILKEKVRRLSESDSSSSDTHGDLYEKYNEISNRLSILEGKIDILVNKK